MLRSKQLRIILATSVASKAAAGPVALAMKPLCLYLASGSPRRLELLRQIGLAPVVVPADVVETALPDEAPRDHVQRLARDKARTVAARLPPDGVVLAADTVVVLDGAILGKPADAADAERMLVGLRGREHEVLTGLYLLRTDDGRSAAAIESSWVRLRPFDDETVRAYVATGEPLDKAGAYGIQGRAALLVESLRGSWSNVVGLPLERVADCLAELGLERQQLVQGRLVG